MHRRGLIFGIVFLMMGLFLFAATGWEYEHRKRSEAQYFDQHPELWNIPNYGLSGIEEGAGWTSLVSIAGGFVMLASEGVKLFRSRQPQ